MIKAAFFDLYHTLVGYDPPREEIEQRVLGEFGVQANLESLRRGLYAADQFFYAELSRVPWGKRSPQEKQALYTTHQSIWLAEAGIKNTDDLASAIMERVQQHDLKLVLFNDVQPALAELRTRGLALGLISNVDRDISPLCDELGLSALLDTVVTSQAAGYSKPQAGIFHEALRRAGVQPAEAVFVGDQYEIDVLGADGAGLMGVLIDRNGEFTTAIRFPRIRSLTELSGLL